MARNRDKRVAPAVLVPGARSVISLGLGYGQARPAREGAGRGRISEYASGADYHDVMRTKLASLWEFVLAAAPGAAGRSFVDTAPVLERDLAQAAGL